MFNRFRTLSLLGVGCLSFVCLGIAARPVAAATCSITADTVIDQAYVDGGSCTAIEIQGNVSTTWIGPVDLGGGSVTVKTGYTMTAGSSSEILLGSNDDFIVETDATATHLLEDSQGLRITARNVTIHGALSVSQKGCRQAGGSGDNGYGVNLATGGCEYAVGGFGQGGGAGGAGGGGGSYGGAGGGGGPSAGGGAVIYGNSLVPAFLGSGGGTGYYGTAFGGAGGGLIHVTSTGTLFVDGSIDANGGAGRYEGVYNGGGGGAGGSILIHAHTLAGSGTISADGGSGGAGGGGGSGGRIAVYFDTLTTFSLSRITAAYGAGGLSGAWGNGVNGGAGTTYLLNRYDDDGAGTLTITSGFDFPSLGDYTRDSISLYPNAKLSCSSTEGIVTVSSTAWLAFDHVTWNCAAPLGGIILASNVGISTTDTSLTFSAATSVTITAPTWTNTSTTLVVSQSGAQVYWNVDADLDFENFNFDNARIGVNSALGGYVFIQNPIGITMVSSTINSNVSTTLRALSLDSLSSWSANEKGCGPGSSYNEDGFGPDLTTGICAPTTAGYGHPALSCCGGAGGGAAYGGTGGAGTIAPGQATTYGTTESPEYVGSGGGGGFGTPGSGGGGLIRILVAQDLNLDGQVTANGGAAPAYGGPYGGGGGGSGGGVYLSVQGTLSGSGSIRANGGTGSTGGQGSGGGGGGRIALLYSGFTFSGVSSTSGGVGGNESGTDGTIYTLQVNVAPNVPVSLGPTALVNGSTTGTNNPTFTFTLSDPDVGDTLSYRIQIDDSSDFSSPVVDYVSGLGAQGSRSFQVGQVVGSGTYAAGSSGQTLSDGSYYWRVKAADIHAAASSYVTAHGGAVAFVVDTASRYLSFLRAAESGRENIGTTSVYVILNAPSFEDVTVHYAATDGTALGDGSDYLLPSGVATISAGETSTTIPLTLVDDAVSEFDESFTITLSSPTHVVIGSNTSTIYTILDDDPVSPNSRSGSSQGGGGAVGGNAGGGMVMPITSLGSPTPQASTQVDTNPVTTEAPSRMERDTLNETRTQSLVEADLRAFQLVGSAADQQALVNFIVYGTSDATVRLGSGERRALVRDALQTMGTAHLSMEDLARLTEGMIPRLRNISIERQQLPRIRLTFRTLFGHDPNFQNPQENLAWNALMYRIRFTRDLADEQRGIQAFRRIFHRSPTDPFQWAVVRVIAYVQS